MNLLVRPSFFLFGFVPLHTSCIPYYRALDFDMKDATNKPYYMFEDPSWIKKNGAILDNI